MKIRIDNMTICLIVLIFIVFVFLLADYRVFRKFIRLEKDRNISFTSQQVKDYINNYSSSGISEEFVEEFLNDVLQNASSSDDDSNEVDENAS
ncbi:MAG: hypothetical protein HFG90_00815 [Acholeplasmatales bacterium]|nr:hypothetical protein [Acholeplasmatales bacterium]